MRNTIVKIVLAALCLMLFPQFQNAQNVEVKGNSKEFAGEELVVYQYADLITYQEKELVRFKVEANGDFKFNFFNDQINFIYIPLGIYKGYFFAEPGKSYEVILPERKDKTTAQILNPYFSEEYLHLGITGVDSTSLNYQIAIYDSRFNRELMFVMESLKEHKGQHVVDSSFSILEEQFKWSDIEYFNEYKSGKLAFFKFISSQMRAKKVAKDQISNHPVLFANTAYMELFNQVFKNYFMYHVRTKDGKQLAIDVATKDYQGLKKTLNQNPLIKNDTIKELVILKSLYDEFYADNFSRASMLALLDSLYFNSKVPENQLIAQNIRQQVTHLLHGFYPPVFELKDKDGNLISLDKFKGKYVYINFAHSQSYTCLKDFELLKQIYERQKENLEIVSICIDDNPEDLWFFSEQNQYDWIFLHYGNEPAVIKEFDIRVFPTYFLVNREGKLQMSLAPSPGENFEQKFNFLLREEYLNKVDSN